MNRVIILDLLRFFAALSVVLYHYTYVGYMKYPAILIDFEAMGSIFKYGQLGVELFFMISGFVILLSSENKSIFHFVISRIARLYPAYWVGVSLTALLIVLFGEDIFSVTLRQYVVNLTMIQQFFAVPNIDSVYWTLFVEIRFYFLVFLLIFFGQIKFLKYYFLGWSVVSVINWFYPINAYLSYYLILDFAPFFIAGSIFYIAYRDNRFTIFDYTILLVSFVSAIFYLIQKKSSLEITFDTEFSMIVFLSILSAFFLLFFVISKKNVVIKKDKRIYMMLGAVTYPLYLIHDHIGYILFIHFSSFLNKYVLLVLTILVMLLLAYGIHITVEKKFGKWMKQKMFQLFYKVMFKAKQ